MLELARRRIIRLIWTVHNLYPHAPCVIPRLDRCRHRLPIRACSLFLLHGNEAADVSVREYLEAKSRILIALHGCFHGYYPDGITREDAR